MVISSSKKGEVDKCKGEIVETEEISIKVCKTKLKGDLTQITEGEEDTKDQRNFKFTEDTLKLELILNQGRDNKEDFRMITK